VGQDPADRPGAPEPDQREPDRSPDDQPANDGRNETKDDQPANDGRDETKLEQLDRQFQDLLQELRVSQTGVQILFAFLLGIAFTQAFAVLDDWERGLYVGTLIATALATVFFIGPVSFHRIVFRRKLRESLVLAANWMAITGLVFLMIAMCGAILLVVTVVLGLTWASWITIGLLVIFLVIWYALPLLHRWRVMSEGRE
jgi:hypothetical protein